MEHIRKINLSKKYEQAQKRNADAYKTFAPSVFINAPTFGHIFSGVQEGD